MLGKGSKERIVPIGRTARKVFQQGLSASYRPGRDAIWSAIDHGVNYCFA